MNVDTISTSNILQPSETLDKPDTSLSSPSSIAASVSDAAMAAAATALRMMQQDQENQDYMINDSTMNQQTTSVEVNSDVSADVNGDANSLLQISDLIPKIIIGPFWSREELEPMDIETVRKIEPFYSNKMITEYLVPLITQKSKVPLRALNWLVTNYSKKQTIVYPWKTPDDSITIVDVYALYQNWLKQYKRQRFDPFRRHTPLYFINPETKEIHSTRVGQINFLYFAWIYGLYQFAKDNIEDILLDIKITLSSSPSTSTSSTTSKLTPEDTHAYTHLMDTPEFLNFTDQDLIQTISTPCASSSSSSSSSIIPSVDTPPTVINSCTSSSSSTATTTTTSMMESANSPDNHRASMTNIASITPPDIHFHQIINSMSMKSRKRRRELTKAAPSKCQIFKIPTEYLVVQSPSTSSTGKTTTTTTTAAAAQMGSESTNESSLSVGEEQTQNRMKDILSVFSSISCREQLLHVYDSRSRKKKRKLTNTKAYDLRTSTKSSSSSSIKTSNLGRSVNGENRTPGKRGRKKRDKPTQSPSPISSNDMNIEPTVQPTETAHHTHDSERTTTATTDTNVLSNSEVSPKVPKKRGRKKGFVLNKKPKPVPDVQLPKRKRGRPRKVRTEEEEAAMNMTAEEKILAEEDPFKAIGIDNPHVFVSRPKRVLNESKYNKKLNKLKNALPARNTYDKKNKKKDDATVCVSSTSSTSLSSASSTMDTLSTPSFSTNSNYLMNQSSMVVDPHDQLDLFELGQLQQQHQHQHQHHQQTNAHQNPLIDFRSESIDY